jgi:hypothetical protein
MKHIGTNVKKLMAVCLMFMATMLSIGTAKLERYPQSCGMLMVDKKEKSQRVLR